MLAPRRLGYYTNRERKRFPKIKVEVACTKMNPAVVIRVHEMSEFTLTLAELFVKSCEFAGVSEDLGRSLGVMGGEQTLDGREETLRIERLWLERVGAKLKRECCSTGAKRSCDQNRGVLN